MANEQSPMMDYGSSFGISYSWIIAIVVIIIFMQFGEVIFTRITNRYYGKSLVENPNHEPLSIMFQRDKQLMDDLAKSGNLGGRMFVSPGIML
jgi:hypothetical protein